MCRDTSDQPYERHALRGGFYLREREGGRRTRVYITLEAANRAVARGELYTDEQYTALTSVRVGAKPRRSFVRAAK